MSKSEDTLSASMKVLKTSTCKTLSGKSTLTYQIGATSDSIFHLRISKNSGGGFFSDEWVAVEAIHRALKKKRPEGTPVTSFLLDPLYVGRSSNNSSFLMAILKHLKLVQPLPKKKREFEAMDPKPFLDQVAKLMNTSEKAKAPRKKAPAKKRSQVRKKTV